MHEGSESGYVHGCRCRNCLAAHATAQRKHRAKTKVKTDRMKLELGALREYYATVEAAQQQLNRVLTAAGEQVPR
jgi:hypothetical protein